MPDIGIYILGKEEMFDPERDLKNISVITYNENKRRKHPFLSQSPSHILTEIIDATQPILT